MFKKLMVAWAVRGELIMLSKEKEDIRKTLIEFRQKHQCLDEK